jgi:hypothetical protein
MSAVVAPDAVKRKAKAKCCKDSTRCKTCPVVLKRLEALGRAERMDKRTYLVDGDVTKRDLKPLRKR